MSERSFARALPPRGGPAARGLRRGTARGARPDPAEDSAPSLDAVARATGFSSAEVLRRAFHRRVGVSPAAYRERFRLAA